MARTGASSHLTNSQDGTHYLREIGSRITLVRGDKPQSEFSDLIGIHKNTLGNYERGDREMGVFALARLVKLGWNANWLLTGQGPERLDGPQAVQGEASQDLSAEHLMIATELADETLQGLWLPKPKYFELVGLVYDALTQGLPYADIIEFTRPAAESMAKQGAGDGSKQGLDPAAPGRAGRRAAG